MRGTNRYEEGNGHKGENVHPKQIFLCNKKRLPKKSFLSTQCGLMQFRINPYLNSPCKLQIHDNTEISSCQDNLGKK